MLFELDQWHGLKTRVHLWPCFFFLVPYLQSVEPLSIKLPEPETGMIPLISLSLSTLNFPTSNPTSNLSPSLIYSSPCMSFQCVQVPPFPLLPVQSKSTITSSLHHCRGVLPVSPSSQLVPPKLLFTLYLEWSLKRQTQSQNPVYNLSWLPHALR